MSNGDLLELGRLVENLPNGCSLVHHCTQPGDEPQAWRVLTWEDRLLASGPTALDAMRGLDRFLRAASLFGGDTL